MAFDDMTLMVISAGSSTSQRPKSALKKPSTWDMLPSRSNTDMPALAPNIPKKQNYGKTGNGCGNGQPSIAELPEMPHWSGWVCRAPLLADAALEPIEKQKVYKRKAAISKDLPRKKHRSN